jgi:transcriptional regulator with GAF, ATPase, and Fis domain
MTRRTPLFLTNAELPNLVGQGEKIRCVCRLIGSVAKCEVTVLLQSESGTGKEIVANAVHAHSLRNRGPFVKVNCAALSETLLESELFGHVKGAFTGAIRDRRGRFKQADGGTILLDEIGSLSLAGQAKLLRVLQEHEFEPVGSSATAVVDVRVLAATNTELQKAVAEGKFREDLFYRLNVFAITLPPLRERKEDIALLAQHFLQKYNLAIGKKIQAFAAETLAAMMRYDWPGNVRELENAVEHAVLVEKSLVILPSSLPMNLIPQESPEVSKALGLRDMLNLFEKEIILDTLIRANWIKKRAADMLRIDARNLPYLLRKHNLSDGLRPN